MHVNERNLLGKKRRRTNELKNKSVDNILVLSGFAATHGGIS